MSDAMDDGAIAAPILLRKGEFAALIGVSAGRVSQLLAEGVIHGAALVATEDGERINAEIGQAQYIAGTDPVQRAAQARSGDDDVASDLPLPVDAGMNEDNRRLLRAKADSAAVKAQLDRARLHEQSGRWVEVEAVRREWAAGIAEIWTLLEADMPEVALEIATECGVDRRLAVISLMKGLRRVRSRFADRYRERRDALPAALPEPEAA